MKIKRYTATSMRIALAQVRAEQGPDAVILSSRRSDEGIEVIAAVDYDESLILDAGRSRTPPPATPPPAAPPPVPTASPAVARRAAAAAPAAGALLAAAAPAAPAATLSLASGAAQGAVAAAPADAGYGEMRRELLDLRQLLERELADIGWRDKRLREPVQARIFEALSALDIAPDVAQALAELTPKDLKVPAAGNVPAALLAKYLPMTTDLDALNSGILVVVGPTGAGKTTTIAKLAARWSLSHGSEDLALVSTDGYRVGAREQLATFARILGVPLHAASDGPDLARVLARLAGKKLVLVDTAGVGPRDARLSQQLEALRLGAGRARALLALPAQCEPQALDAILNVFAPLAPVACVLTKIDEAASLGAALSAVLRHRLPIAYLCNGQRVPEDMHGAHGRRIWLVKTAMMLKQRQPPSRAGAAPIRHPGATRAHA